jgi:hypothetical protein
MYENSLSLEEIKNGKGPLWVLNNTKAGGVTSLGEVLVEIRTKIAKVKSSKQHEIHDLENWMRSRTIGAPLKSAQPIEEFSVEHLQLPATWLPMCVTNEFSRKVLLESEGFIHALEEGILVAISEKLALRLLENEAAPEELARLDKQRDARRFVETTQLELVPSGYDIDPMLSIWQEQLIQFVEPSVEGEGYFPPPIFGESKPLSSNPARIVSNSDLDTCWDMYEGCSRAIIDPDIYPDQKPEIVPTAKPKEKWFSWIISVLFGRK